MRGLILSEFTSKFSSSKIAQNSRKPPMFKRPKVKMKAPTCCYQNSFMPLSIVFLISLLIMLRLCNQFETTKLMPQKRSMSSSSEQELKMEEEFQEKQPFSSSKPSSDTDQEQTNELVIASRWQNEVLLPCRIPNLDEEQTVTWIRKRDSFVLTVDKLKLIDDSRFQLAQSQQDWTLILSQPKNLDAGFYECQVSSMESKLRRLVELQMVESDSHISNFTSLFIRPNEQLNVTCTIESAQQTDFVYWYKNKEPILFHNLKLKHQKVEEKGNLVEQTTKLHKRSSALLIRTERATSYMASNYDAAVGMQVYNSLQDNQAVKREDINVQQDDDDDGDDHDHDDGHIVSKDNNDQGETSKIRMKERERSKKMNKKRIKGTKTKRVKQGHQQQQTQNIKLVRSSSSLVISKSQLNDTANYTCLPSNAKPSHISVFVLENGPQSQPEKRSLLPSDGVYSINCLLVKKNTFSVIFKLIRLLELKIVELFEFCWQKTIVISREFEPKGETKLESNVGLLELIGELIFAHDFHRSMVTVVLVFYNMRN